MTIKRIIINEFKAFINDFKIIIFNSLIKIKIIINVEVKLKDKIKNI